MVDYLGSHEALLKAELDIVRLKKREEVLSILDSTEKALSSRVPEFVPATFKTEEQLGKNDELVMPLTVMGNMLGVGKHKNRFYTAEDLKKSVETMKGKKIPIKLDHRKNEAGSTIGVVTRLFWNEEKQSVGYEGHINDITHARNVLDMVSRQVSAGILAIDEFDSSQGIIFGRDPEYSELSIVELGAYQENSIEAIGGR